MRLDLYLADTYKISRNKAQFAIDAWKVKVNGILIKKTWHKLSQTDNVELTSQEEIHYVARSALKLKWLLEQLNWNIQNSICLDIGSSTWWFCQILLENNVFHIYAVDVGTLQLHPTIRQDTRVESFENTDIRDFAQNFQDQKLDFIFCDVSFISLHNIIESILSLKKDTTKCALLFKPQFEVGKENITKLWVPINQKIIDEKLNNFCLILKQKWVQIEKIIPSCLTWENGNKEYFIIF